MNYLPHVLSISKLENFYCPIELIVDNVPELVIETEGDHTVLEGPFAPDASRVWWEWRPK